MKKKLFLILITFFSLTASWSQDIPKRHIWKTEIGNYYVKYVGRGSWYDGVNACNSGWKLPTPLEFNTIILGTPGGKCWDDLFADGWTPDKCKYMYYWSSLDDGGDSWSCDRKCATVIMFGYDGYSPTMNTREKDFSSLGIILVKKIVNSKKKTKKR